MESRHVWWAMHNNMLVSVKIHNISTLARQCFDYCFSCNCQLFDVLFPFVFLQIYVGAIGLFTPCTANSMQQRVINRVFLFVCITKI